MTIKNKIQKDLEKAIGETFGVEVKPEVTRTADPKMGDYATNTAFKISSSVKRSPVQTAKLLADSMSDQVFCIKYYEY